MAEVHREEAVDFPVKVNCPKCGDEIVLWFNGGELDGKWCCGRSYRLEHVRIDFVISEDEG